MLADAQFEVDKANCAKIKSLCLGGCLLLPPSKRADCVQACNALEGACLASAQEKHAKALLECAEEYKKCVENCTKNPSQPPEIKQPALPKPKRLLPDCVQITGASDGSIMLTYSCRF